MFAIDSKIIQGAKHQSHPCRQQHAFLKEIKYYSLFIGKHSLLWSWKSAKIL